MSAEELPKEHPPDGYRWVISATYEPPDGLEEVPGEPGWWRPVEGKASSYTVADAFNWDIQRGTFKTKKAAQKRADELNCLDVWGEPPDPALKHRRDRLKKLSPYFGSWAYEGPPAARWPANPKRYLVHTMGHGWHPEDWDYLADTQAEIEDLLADEESTVLRIVDLDTGKDVEFRREVSVSVNLPAQSGRTSEER